MFPLKSSDAYIEPTGKRSTLGAKLAEGGGGGSDLPEYSETDAGKVLTVGDDGELEWGSISVKKNLILYEGAGSVNIPITRPISVPDNAKVFVFAINGEASQKTLTANVSLDNTPLVGTSVEYTEFSYNDPDNKRNNRLTVFSITEGGDYDISISLSDGGSYSSFVYFIVDPNWDYKYSKIFSNNGNASTTGSNNKNGYSLAGSCVGPDGAAFVLGEYTSGETATSPPAGNNSYGSTFIIWFEPDT